MERQQDSINRRPKRRLAQFNSLIFSDLQFLGRIIAHANLKPNPLYIIGIHMWMVLNMDFKGSFFTGAKRASVEMKGLPRFAYPERS